MIIYSNVISQTLTSSPYSRFGLGDLNSTISVEQAAMGGSSVVYSSPNSINFNNPAAYSSLYRQSVLLSSSVFNQTNRLSTSQLDQTTTHTNFGYIALAMPASKYVFLSSGILPYSNIGYDLEYADNEDQIGNVDYRYYGLGGVHNYYLGAAVKLHNNLSVGINRSYLFGGLSRNRTADFDDDTYLNVNSVNTTNVSGNLITTGFLFNSDLSDNQNLSIGITYQHNANLEARRNLLETTYKANSSLISIKDTVRNIVDTGSLVLPNEISAGISYSSKQWIFIANYTSQNWSNYQLKFGDEIDEDNLDNSFSLSGGLQYTPDDNSITQYWKRLSYRIGSNYNKSYLRIMDSPLLERSITFGLGIPVRKSNTFYNISVQLGERGITNHDYYFFATKTNFKLIKERFIKISFGVTFRGLWFVKRKYD